MDEYVILVDDTDKAWGKMEKQEAHELGLLHRAISVFIFNSDKELLLQQRADSKYHSPGLWTNTCCSHPRYGEDTADAANRRLMEEMGLECQLEPSFCFTYKAHFGNGLTEFEYDHVFFGSTDTKPHPSDEEVQNWKYVSMYELREDLAKNPDQYTEWFKICFDQVFENFLKM